MSVPTSNTLAFDGVLANAFTGETHVLYAALGLTAVGLYLILTYPGNKVLLILGLVILMGAFGIAVDVVAHGYSH